MKILFSFLLVSASGAFCETTVKKSEWRGIAAFTLTDGKSEAVVVPALGGRVMEFRKVGGMNWLWNGEAGSEKNPPTQFWGGDKTYVGPHSGWRFALPAAWPPPAPDSTEHSAEILADGLRLVSPAWEGYDGARVTREFRFAENGEFIVKHDVAAVPESRAVGAVWTITQTVPAVTFVPLNPTSPYKENFFWFDWSKGDARKAAVVVSPTLLRLDHAVGEVSKMGAHPSQPALAAVRDGALFLQKAVPQKGNYPEGADGAGFSVEVYHHDGRGAAEYVELEFLSPLRRLDAGATLTTRWSIHTLPDGWTAQTIEELLTK